MIGCCCRGSNPLFSEVGSSKIMVQPGHLPILSFYGAHTKYLLLSLKFYIQKHIFCSGLMGARTPTPLNMILPLCGASCKRWNWLGHSYSTALIRQKQRLLLHYNCSSCYHNPVSLVLLFGSLLWEGKGSIGKVFFSKCYKRQNEDKLPSTENFLAVLSTRPIRLREE